MSIYDQVKEANKQSDNVTPISNGSFGVNIECAATIKPKAQPWYLKNMIPLDTSTMIVGYGGVGKTQLLTFFASMASTGKTFQIGGTEHSLPKSNVIMMLAEDDYNYQVVPKLMAADADLECVHLLKMMKDKDGNIKCVDLDAHLNLLEHAIETIGNVKLIVIDPVQYFIGEMKEHKNPAVSQFIMALNDLAKKHHIAIIFCKHLRKSGSGETIGNAVDAVSGSAAWINSPRLSWLIHPNPDRPNQVVMINLKSNIIKKGGQAPTFFIEEREIMADGVSIQTTQLMWSSELLDLSADELLNKKSVPSVEKEIELWIIDTLMSANPEATMVSFELWQSAIDEIKCKKPTFFKVRKRLLDDGILEEFAQNKWASSRMIRIVDPEMFK